MSYDERDSALPPVDDANEMLLGSLLAAYGDERAKSSESRCFLKPWEAC